VREALLVLSDGAVFEGEAIGAAVPDGIATGELVFNTVMSGYQEVITDPSYAGQVIAFTYPHIGNYGAAPDDDESRRPWCRGVVLRDLASRPSSWRCAEGLDRFLERHGVPGIAGVDTRRLTRHIREAGALPCAFGPADEAALLAAARAEPGTEGIDLATAVSTPERYSSGDGPFRVVAYDFGIKRAMLRRLGAMARVDVVPATTTAEEVLGERPDGVLLSNGPGDPAPLGYAVDSIRGLLGRVPVFGICLGHQLLATALGGTTYKLTFGHHGGNHPVQHIGSIAPGGPGGRPNGVEITSQNHNYAVADGSVPDADVTHVNLNDGVIEGLRSRSVAAFGVQYHPEAGPGPHDAAYLFEEFRRLMEAHA
jgi:carbamoyl-phosphate synthase small subunit